MAELTKVSTDASAPLKTAGRIPRAVVDPEIAGLHHIFKQSRMRQVETGKNRILLLDRQALRRHSIAHLLRSSKIGAEIVCVEPSDFETDFDRIKPVGLIVLSVGGSAVSDPEVKADLDSIQSYFPGIPFAVLSDRESLDNVQQSLRNGARGYIPTSLDIRIVAQAIRLIRAGGTFIPSSALTGMDTLDNRLAAPVREELTEHSGFTPRQSEVLALLCQGKSNKSIARALKMEESTVKVHVRHIIRKLKVSNRTEAALLARQMDLPRPQPQASGLDSDPKAVEGGQRPEPRPPGLVVKTDR